MASASSRRTRARRGVQVGVGAACLAGLAAMAACRAPTEITLELSTDVKCADVRGTAITIGDLTSLDAKPSTTVTPACNSQTGRIGSMVIVPSGSKDDTVAIKVVLGVGRDPAECLPPAYGPGCIVARRALHFIASSSLTVPIFMGAVCTGIACNTTETCVGGTCTDATIDDPSKCEAPGGCGESVLAGSSTPGDAAVRADTAVPDASVPDTAMLVPDAAPEAAAPCAANTVCEVVASTTILDVAVTETALFWLDSGGKIMTSALDGTGTRTLVTGEQSPLAGVEANAQFVYWTANGQLRRAGATDGVGPTTVASVAGGCLKWMVAGSKLLAAEPGAASVHVFDVATATLTTPIVAAAAPWGVAGSGVTDLYYTNSVSSGLVRHSNGVTNPIPIIVTNQSFPRCMATDGASLWWANNGSGDLVKSAATGAGAQSIVAGQTGIAGIALAGTWVYWSWQGGIRKRSK